MAVPGNVLPVLVAIGLALSTGSARGDDDGSKWLTRGEPLKGVWENGTQAYYFRGTKDEIVTIELTGPYVKQIGVVMEKSDRDFDFEWITPNSIDFKYFDASGNVRSGDTLRLTLRLPRTAKYSIQPMNDFGKDEAKGSPFTLTVTGGSTPTKVYVRGSLGFMMSLTGSDISGANFTPYGINATLAVGSQRSKKFGIEGVLSGSFLPVDETSVMGLLGVGLRINDPTNPLILRLTVGVAGMAGLNTKLGGGARYDVGTKKASFALEFERIGRTNIFMMIGGLAF